MKFAIETSKTMHAESMKFIEEGLMKNDVLFIKHHLLKWNTCQNYIQTDYSSKTLVLMDATRSMNQLLSKCKQNVIKMFEKANHILKQNSLNPNCFLLQFAVYRNYNCENIFQHSDFENNSLNLRNFLKTISVDGGLGNEAIEIGLRHANQINVSQVILIGDASANTEQDVHKRRLMFGGEDFWKKQVGAETNWKLEINKLKIKKIKVHSFYVAPAAKENFEEISAITGGNCQFLDVNGKNGGELLTEFITLEILKNIGEKNGKSDELVKSYKKTYIKQ